VTGLARLAARAGRRLRHRVGHRGACLLFFAMVDLVYGAILLVDRPNPGTTLSHIAANWPPMPVWGVAWIGVGLLCLIQAFMKDDRAGMVGAMAIKFSWGAAHFWAVADGVDRALAGAVIWTMAIGLVAVVAHWQEPPYDPGGR
jgi:hypothetical protein